MLFESLLLDTTSEICGSLACRSSGQHQTQYIMMSAKLAHIRSRPDGRTTMTTRRLSRALEDSRRLSQTHTHPASAVVIIIMMIAATKPLEAPARSWLAAERASRAHSQTPASGQRPAATKPNSRPTEGGNQAKLAAESSTQSNHLGSRWLALM